MDRKRRTELLNALLAGVLYLLFFLILYRAYALFNIGMRKLSRTSITVAFTFVISMMLFTSVYGGFSIGLKRKRVLFANVDCTVLFSDLVTFLLLQIMNTNPQNPDANARLVIFDRNLPVTLAIFLVQSIALVLVIELGYRIYRRINPVCRSLVIASTPEGAAHTASRVAAFPYDLKLGETISCTCPDWRGTALEHECVFVGDVPPAEKEEIKRFCYENGLPVYVEASFEDVVTAAAESTVLVDVPFLHLKRGRATVVQLAVKRLFDIVVSVLLLIILSPVMGITALVLALSRNGSVIFRQERATVGGRVFRIMKFRTMYKDTAVSLSMRKNDDRITPVGHILRRYRIDELPQLFNIIKGDMSLVGPRPEMLSNVEKYIAEVPQFRYREQMKAGITGLAQLEGCYDTLPRDKAILDLMYIENFSLGLDLKLILRTFTVFFRHDSEGFSEKKVSAPELRTEAKTNRGKEEE